MVRRAPLACIAFIIGGAVLGWIAAGVIFGNRLATADDRVKLAEERVQDYKEKLQGASPDQAAQQIKLLQKKVDEIAALRPAPAPARERDPNALYQYGEAVGDVQGAVISRGNGTVTFRSIHTTGKAQPNIDVEYQDLILHCPGLPAIPPHTVVVESSNVVVNPTCQIIGKRGG